MTDLEKSLQGELIWDGRTELSVGYHFYWTKKYRAHYGVFGKSWVLNEITNSDSKDGVEGYREFLKEIKRLPKGITCSWNARYNYGALKKDEPDRKPRATTDFFDIHVDLNCGVHISSVYSIPFYREYENYRALPWGIDKKTIAEAEKFKATIFQKHSNVLQEVSRHIGHGYGAVSKGYFDGNTVSDWDGEVMCGLYQLGMKSLSEEYEMIGLLLAAADYMQNGAHEHEVLVMGRGFSYTNRPRVFFKLVKMNQRPLEDSLQSW